MIQNIINVENSRQLTCTGVLGLARTGLIFTGIQEGAQPGGGG